MSIRGGGFVPARAVSGGTGTPQAVPWAEVRGKPETFPPSPHRHSLDDVDGLRTALEAAASPDPGDLTLIFDNALT